MAHRTIVQQKAHREFVLCRLPGTEDLPASVPLLLPPNVSETNNTPDKLPSLNPPSMSEYHLVSESLKLLEGITKPVAVVTVCGPYRTGKSYFLSRFLGSHETFKLGHTMKPCTSGIWMSTSVLECDDFVLVLLDTEGIDAATTSPTGTAENSHLLVLALLVSSLLIYNSRNVPRGKDLKKMSYFTNVSKLVDTGDPFEKETLPDFVWLLRDVDRIPVDKTGQEISATAFLHRILQQNCGSSSAPACRALLNYFPSLHCLILPPPSSNNDVLSDIINNRENLSAGFNKSVDTAIEFILSTVRIKTGHDGVAMTGTLLACLIEQYFKAVSKTGHRMPTMRESWLCAIDLKLRKLMTHLADAYSDDMSVLLLEKLPMRDGLDGESGETLLSIHLQVFAKKRLELQKEILSSCPEAITDSKMSQEKPSLLSDFDRMIAEYKEVTGQKKVVGGRFFIFVQKNIESCEDFCGELYKRKYKDKVHTKLQNALSTQIPTTIDKELSDLSREYFTEAAGPVLTVRQVYSEQRAKSAEIEADLQLIPGPVEELKVVGVDADQVKLRWSKPTVNSHSVKRYDVLVKSKGKSWETLCTRTECSQSVLVKGLEASKWYCFAICAGSDKYLGKKVMVVRVRTLLDKFLQDAIHASAVVASPLVYPCMTAYVASGYISRGLQSKSVLDVMEGGLILSMVPVTALIGMTPIVGSMVSSESYKNQVTDRKGDLFETDTDVVLWQSETTVAMAGEALDSDSDDLLVDVPSDSEVTDFEVSGGELSTQDLESSGELATLD